jgi:predicted DNA-binding transcriptional regulator YafY
MKPRRQSFCRGLFWCEQVRDRLKCAYISVSYKLGRLWNYRITDNPYEFRPLLPSPGAAADIFPEPYNVKILYDKSVRFQLIETYGLSCYEECDDGLLLSLEYANRDYIISWILSLGEKSRVIEPPEAVSEFAETAKKLCELYV